MNAKTHSTERNRRQRKSHGITSHMLSSVDASDACTVLDFV